jgi:hypothetical protein
MVDDLLFHELLRLGLLWLCVSLYWVRRRRQAVTGQTCGSPADHEAFARPEAVSRAHDQAVLCRLSARAR